jgi:hypothetical protein
VFQVPDFALPYCFGNSCPCDNDDSLAGCITSRGAGALLIACGSGSVTTDDLVLTASGLPAGQNGILYMGAGQLSLPFGDGLRCVGAGGAGIFRYLPVLGSGANGEIALGPGIAARSQGFAPGGRIGPGDTWNFQAWFRDPLGACGSAFNLSNAVAVTFAP